MRVILEAITNGCVSTTGIEFVDILLSKGGLINMMLTVLLSICALRLGEILEKIGMLEVIVSSILGAAKGVFDTGFCNILTCTFTNIIGGEQYLLL